MAEFDHHNQPQETFPYVQSKERWTMYQCEGRLLPKLSWWGILKRRAERVPAVSGRAAGQGSR